MISRKWLYKKIDKEVNELLQEAKRLCKEGYKLAEQNALGNIAGLLQTRAWIKNCRFVDVKYNANTKKPKEVNKQ